MSSAIKDTSYDATTSQSATVNHEVELRVALANGNAVCEAYWNLDPDSEAEIETITIAPGDLPGEDAYYQVEVVGPNQTKTFTHFYDFSATPTEDDVAAALAELITLHSDVQCVQGGTGVENTAICTAVTPGSAGAFTLNLSCTIASSNSAASGTPISSAVTQAASGTGKVRKLLQATVSPSINAQGYPQIDFTGIQQFNGAAVPVATNRGAQRVQHGSTMDFIKANN